MIFCCLFNDLFYDILKFSLCFIMKSHDIIIYRSVNENVSSMLEACGDDYFDYNTYYNDFLLQGMSRNMVI